MEEETDIEYQRGHLTRKMEAGQDVVLQTDQAAVLHNKYVPKAKYHFIVLSKEDIANVTALSRKHLTLLDHMNELAIQTIEQHTPLPLKNFAIGFKMVAFMNRLNMHVISTDFCADTMKRIQHWNTFNTDFFITLQAVRALLDLNGSIAPMSPETAESLRNTLPVHCNQCSYKTGNFRKFKEHLEYHWRKQENNRKSERQLNHLMANMHLNGDQSGRTLSNVGSMPQHLRPGLMGAPPMGRHESYSHPNNWRYSKKPNPQKSKSNGDNNKN